MYIKRKIEESIINTLNNTNTIIVVYGARQVGKTTLINKLLEQIDLRVLKINAEELKYASLFSSRDLEKMLTLVENYAVLFIDEAQTIENIGVNIKILHDAVPDLKIILSGSSSFDLSNKIKEPLTGRTKTYMLFPLSFSELKAEKNSFQLQELLPDFMVTGGYPRLMQFTTKKQTIAHLRELASSYLYKDILEFSNIKHAKKIYDLLRLLAFQIGHTVSIHELSKNLKMSSETVDHYIDLLEKSFIIFRLSGFSRNLRKEISKQDKIFFYDLGIRNSIINNFAALEDRTDVGQLWENFLISERLKQTHYNQLYKQTYFWRTYTGAELDYIEEYDGKLHAYEFKWGNKIPKVPKSWVENYKNTTFNYVNRANFLAFIL
ncbi:MAG TPA: ATP-binding protein [Lutibacter sp.]|nr:ATP-binding protein [Lutibacter sp.]